jgi:acyl-CoA thioester hydrolase
MVLRRTIETVTVDPDNADGPVGRANRWPLELELEIRTYEIDFAGHVSNIVYVQWLEIARTTLLDAVGLPIPDLLDKGFAPIVARTEIEYRRPLQLGDPVRLSLAITKMRSLSAFMEFEVGSKGETAATARQLGLFVSTTTGKPRRLTSQIRDRFAPYVIDGA